LINVFCAVIVVKNILWLAGP